MFQIQNVPIVIEPGVNAIEAEFCVTDEKHKRRSFPVHLFRVALDENSAAKLPFVPATKLPHVFSLAQNTDDSPVLVVYDVMGRINIVFVKDESGKAWEKREVADEHAGKSVKQFSVRYFFNNEKARNDFMERVDKIMSSLQYDTAPSLEDVMAAFRLLSRARTGPVVLPMAVAKSDMRRVKI
jgi:hypothetical protein